MRLLICLIAVLAVAAEPDSATFGPDGAFHLEYSTDSFGLRSHGVMEGTKLYPLPQSTLETYTKMRPEDLRRNPISATGGKYNCQETIGPHQLEGGRLWFGGQFYDAEGSRGVGAFGYFDTATKTYEMYSPVEVARFEVRAILVEANKVWVALDHFGENTSKTPGGLVEWDRTTHTSQLYPLEFNIDSIHREGRAVRLTTTGGYALLTPVTIRRFRMDGDTAVPIDRFPAPPSGH